MLLGCAGSAGSLRDHAPTCDECCAALLCTGGRILRYSYLSLSPELFFNIYGYES
jgi:hypothetical protein